MLSIAVPSGGRGCLLAVLGNMNKRPKLCAAWEALDDHVWVIGQKRHGTWFRMNHA